MRGSWTSRALLAPVAAESGLHGDDEVDDVDIAIQDAKLQSCKIHLKFKSFAGQKCQILQSLKQ